MSLKVRTVILLLLLLCLACTPCAAADYKQMLKKGTTKDELEELYLQYASAMEKKEGVDPSAILVKIAGEKGYQQSFLLACLSNGWSVRAADLDSNHLPPCGVWGYSKENYEGIVRQFPYDCKDMRCQDVGTLEGFVIKSLRMGSGIQVKAFSNDGLTGKCARFESSQPSLSFSPQSLRLRTPPRIDYVTITDYHSDLGKASMRLHVSGANLDDGSKLIVDQQKVASALELRLDNSTWLDLGNDSAEAGYNLDPTYFGYPVYHYDSITTELKGIELGQALSIVVHNSFGMPSNELTYVVPTPDKLDSDGDGLLDAWETGDVDGLNLVELGANPYRKDVYVEVDRMIVPGRIWSDFSELAYPRADTFAESARAFASAPIINPDLSTGISLHVDHGQSDFKGKKPEGGTAIPWRRFLGYSPKDWFPRKYPKIYQEDYYNAVDLRNDPTFFSPARARVFRYCVFGDQQFSSRSTGGGKSQSTFIVTLGVCRMNAISLNYQTGVFLHELGHMFGLSHHGSGRPFNYKPNFNSLMNYKFVFQGRDIDGKLGKGSRRVDPGEHVYSYSEGMRATLNEAALNEVVGVANHYPQDWNGNGVIDTEPVKAIISKHKKTDEPRVLNDCADWAQMEFRTLEKPPVVKRARPKRLIQEEITGIAKIPEGVDFGFMCEVDGAIQTGQWKVVGKVTQHEPGKITFETEAFRASRRNAKKAMTGHLAYRLPGNKQLAINVGDPITILHDSVTDQKRLERELHISSDRQLILATAPSKQETVPQSADRALLSLETTSRSSVRFYWSDPSDNDLEQPLKTVPTIPPPVTLKYPTGSQTITINPSKKGYQSVNLDGEEYLFRVLDRQDGRRRTPLDSNDTETDTDQSVDCLLIKMAQETPIKSPTK
ncbi:MAG: hypothetical protein AAGI63_06195 [Planctomycetota bacterium]